METLKAFISDTLVLNRIHNWTVKRVNRYFIGLFVSIAFSLLAAYVVFFAFGLFYAHQNQYLGVLFLVVLFLLCFTEVMTIINLNFADNVFSRSAVITFPISRRRLFTNILANRIIGVRLTYVLPFLVILYYNLLSRPGRAPILIASTMLLYVLVSIVYTSIEYIYGMVKYNYAASTEKIVFLTLVAVGALLFLAANNHYLNYRQLSEAVHGYLDYFALKSV